MGRKSKQKQQRRAGEGPASAAHVFGQHAEPTTDLSKLRAQVTAGRAAGFLVVATAVFQGLFFSEAKVAVATAVLVGGAAWFVRKPHRLAWDWQDLALFAVAVLAIMSVAWAANREYAVVASGVWGSAFVLYVIWRRGGPNWALDFVDGVLAAGVLLLLVGVLEALQIVNLTQWFLGARLTLGLEYPDTAGALAFALAWMALWRCGLARAKWAVPVLMAIASGMVLAGLLTVSRGALLAVAIAAVGGLAVTPRSELGLSIRRGLIAFISGAIATTIAIKSSFIPGLAVAVLLGAGLEELVGRLFMNRRAVPVVVGVIIVALFGLVGSRLTRPIPLTATIPLKVTEAISTPRVTVTLSGAGTVNLTSIAENAYGTPTVVHNVTATVRSGPDTVSLSMRGAPVGTTAKFMQATLVSGATSVVSVTPSSPLIVLDRTLPASIASRFADISSNSIVVWQRVLFITDAFRLWSLRPILGWGGGGWQASYRTTQSFNYTSDQTHSSFTDVLTSYGAVGAIAYVIFWALALLGLLRYQKGRPNRGFAVAAIATLVVHSLFDFDFAYMMMVLLVIALLATLGGPPGKPVWRPNGRYMALGAAVLALLMAGSLVAHAEGNAALAAQQAKNPTQAITDLTTGLTFAPYDSSLWSALATVQANTGTQAAPEVQAAAASALASAPNDPILAQALSVQLLRVGAISQSLAVANRVLAEAPHWALAYATVARDDLITATNFYAQHNLKSTKKTLLAGQAELEKFDRIYASEAAIPTSVNIGPDINFLLTEGETAALLGDTKLAITGLTQAGALSPSQAPVADAWLYALGTVSGGVPNMNSLAKGWNVSGGVTSTQVSAMESAIRSIESVR